MPSLIKSLSVALLAGGLIGPFGWTVAAHAQTNRAQAQTGQPPAKRAQSTSGTTSKSATGGTGTSTRGTSVATAPAGRTQLADERPAAPKGAPLRIPNLGKEMEEILAEWEQKSAKIKRLEGNFTRISYDSVFMSESHSSGKYCFEHPDKGAFEQTGVAPRKEGAKSQRGYELKAGATERWVCNGEKILKIDDGKREYEAVPIPPEDRGQNIRNSPLPFVFGLKAVEAKVRYRFELNEAKTNDKQIVLRVYPLTLLDSPNYKMADVQLDRATCIPMAVKLYDTTGNKEDLYLFAQKGMSINKQTWIQWISGDPLNPKMGGYRLMVTPNGGTDSANGTQLAPKPTDRRSAQTSGPATKGVAPRQAPQRTAQLLEDDDPPARSNTKGSARP